MKVEVHSGLPDKLAHACRLLRKAEGSGAQVVVSGEPGQLDRLDQLLWTFEALAFVPHARLRRGAAPGLTHQRSRLWLADEPPRAPHREVLVNLGADAPPAWAEFERVIDLVGASDAERGPGRERWRLYGEQPGVERLHHRFGAEA